MNRVYILERSETILKTFITQFFHIRSQHFEQLETTGNGNELGEFMRSVCNFLSTVLNKIKFFLFDILNYSYSKMMQ